jgi:hypothetical protein
MEMKPYNAHVGTGALPDFLPHRFSCTDAFVKSGLCRIFHQEWHMKILGNEKKGYFIVKDPGNQNIVLMAIGENLAKRENQRD